MSKTNTMDMTGLGGDEQKEMRGSPYFAIKTWPWGLHTREFEVLRLIALVATNREISIDLQISPYTVKSHVIHIFNKIGVNCRSQTSAWGALHGLLQQKEGGT